MSVFFFILFSAVRFGALVSARGKSFKNITSISYAPTAVGDFSFLGRLQRRTARRVIPRAWHRGHPPQCKASHPRITVSDSLPACAPHRITSRRRSSWIRQLAHRRHRRSPLSNKTWHSQTCRVHLGEDLVFLSGDPR